MGEIPRGIAGIRMHRCQGTEADLYNKLLLVKRSKLKNSSQQKFRQIWSNTSEHYITTGTRLHETEINDSKKKLQNDRTSQAESHIHSLVCQGQLAQCVTESVSRTGVDQWSRLSRFRSTYSASFGRRSNSSCQPHRI